MSSSFPPPPKARRPSRPVWKRWWFWAIVVVVILIAAGAGSSNTTQTESEAESPSPVASAGVSSPSVASPAPETARVPNVGGKSLDVATSRLEAAGFVIDIKTKLTNAAPAGKVLQQSERAGSNLEVGATITLTVAKALPRIPDVVGKTLVNAKRGAREGWLRRRKGDAADVQPTEGDSDFADTHRWNVGASRPESVACDGEACSAAREQLHTGLLTVPTASVRLRLRGRWWQRTGVCVRDRASDGLGSIRARRGQRRDWLRVGGARMKYRIVCTNQVPVNQPRTHAHIVRVGTGTTPQQWSRMWELAEVIQAIRSGQHQFYTQSPSTGRQASVLVVPCGVCARDIIRSAADAVRDNNLDNLPSCGLTQT